MDSGSPVSSVGGKNSAMGAASELPIVGLPLGLASAAAVANLSSPRGAAKRKTSSVFNPMLGLNAAAAAISAAASPSNSASGGGGAAAAGGNNAGGSRHF